MVSELILEYLILKKFLQPLLPTPPLTKVLHAYAPTDVPPRS